MKIVGKWFCSALAPAGADGNAVLGGQRFVRTPGRGVNGLARCRAPFTGVVNARGEVLQLRLKNRTVSNSREFSSRSAPAVRAGCGAAGGPSLDSAPGAEFPSRPFLRCRLGCTSPAQRRHNFSLRTTTISPNIPVRTNTRAHAEVRYAGAPFPAPQPPIFV